ncbi:DUF4326 domain-containing protein [Enterococcus faecium]|uniref:DUF4326 domain-containing protein n=1 Tax=Escherichia phage PGN829.1 TaxID=2315696 RepID=A0A385II47_9CAUD|nr:DUF4326 domain-containing protein [Enterococcus faecium]YP_010659700.1 ribonucleotide reductase NrdA-like [Escherichia phage PGN829.1]AXY82561.1 hypothetical protein [Escherichia phage PGN829.1]MCH5412610.1 DUF4326 domain-containing protein [Enterococcus faecium]QHQ49134.1 DUF4326 domain-containing protein [Enterococcus faecium]
MKTITLGDDTNALLGVSARPITIVNKHHGKSGEYIGRGSPLGNPFVIGKDGSREQVITKYRVWLHEQIMRKNPVVLNELNRLGNKAIDEKGLALQCFCYPKPCHGEVIKEKLVKAMYNYFAENPNG